MSDTPTGAVLYAAKSTEDKKDSIPTQLADCRAMAERVGWEVLREHTDEGFSAYSGNRGPGLQAALAAAVEAAPCVLVAQHSDRIARGAGDSPEAARHLVEVTQDLRRAGVTLRTVQDDFFHDERIGVLMAALMGTRNTEDSARKSAATRAGKRRAWERGEFGGGPAPDGFELMRDGERRALRLDPTRIDLIRLIGDLSDQGWGDPSVARELNRRGLRTQGGRPWTRRRVQDTLTNATYYGGIPWRRGRPDEETNWDATHPAPWTREDWERRSRAKRGRDLAAGSDRTPPKGRIATNHALAGLALCGCCGERMQAKTASYRRKDGTRRRFYACTNTRDCTGLCDAPPVDAEAVDRHVADALERYLGDFEAWRDQLARGYSSERERLGREIESALADLAEQERSCERAERLPALAEDDAQAQVALRAAAHEQAELDRRRTRLEAARTALAEVPDQAPEDAMLDYYNELSEAIRGRLVGADTIARVNDALHDCFQAFVLTPPPHLLGDEGTMIVPVPHARGSGSPTRWSPKLERAMPDDAATPPLRATSAGSADAHA
jgi:site-specific DNA recombinase